MSEKTDCFLCKLAPDCMHGYELLNGMRSHDQSIGQCLDFIPCNQESERYLRIDPSGEISWISIDRVPYEFEPSIEGMSLDQIYAAIGCDCMEQVYTIIPGIVILVDESGKLKTPPQPHNELASRLYMGYLRGCDNIVGPAIVAAMRPTPPIGEQDLFPLRSGELLQLSLALGVVLPEVPADE